MQHFRDNLHLDVGHTELKMEKFKISVIIPCYYGEKHIARTLDNIVSQNYGNLEIIVVIDGLVAGTHKALARKPAANKTVNNQGLQETPASATSGKGLASPARRAGKGYKYIQQGAADKPLPGIMIGCVPRA